MCRPKDCADRRRWAFRVPIKAPKGIGEYTVRIVLLDHADQHGLAYPSAERLAEDVDGLSRWHVRHAFAALQDNGIITHHGYVSRAKCWHIAFAEVREPVTSPRDNVASPPATWADPWYAEVTGEAAGPLATKRKWKKEEEQSPQRDQRTISPRRRPLVNKR